MWRIVTARVATLEEIESSWCVDDIFDANAVLDFQDAAKAMANEQANKGAR